MSFQNLLRRRGRFSSYSPRRAVVAVFTTLAMGGALTAWTSTSPASAGGAQWTDGVAAHSTVTNCTSVILGNPTTEWGVTAYVGYANDPSTNEPSVGQVYYLHEVVYGTGNPCVTQRVQPEFSLPPNTALAISASDPVYCFAIQPADQGGTVADQADCPQLVQAGAWGGTYRIASPDEANHETWPVPQGYGWEFQIPVKSSAPFASASGVRGFAKVVDGNANPSLATTSFVQVFAQPSGGTPPPTTTPPGAAGGPVEYNPLVPGRILDTRQQPGITTIDGQGLGHGVVAGGSEIQVQVGGRAGVPANASAVVLNVTVTGAQGASFVTVYPCGATRPTTSNLNFTLGQTIPNAVIAKLGSSGTVCIYTNATTDLIADVNGYFPAGSSYQPIVPARLLETRTDPGSSTVDGQGLGHGLVASGTEIELQVAGRAGVPATASAAVLNVTVTGAQADGYVTVYPCGATRPTTSNLNYSAGQTIPNAVISKLGSNGKICIYANGTTHVLADINGYFPATSNYKPIVPGRILDTRTDPGSITIDGQGRGHGVVAGGTEIELQVAGRAGVPANATSAVLNVTVTGASGDGYVTVYPCGATRPTTSNLNYTLGQTIPNAVVAKLGTAGKVCLYANSTTHLIADVNGYVS